MELQSLVYNATPPASAVMVEASVAVTLTAPLPEVVTVLSFLITASTVLSMVFPAPAPAPAKASAPLLPEAADRLPAIVRA